VEMGVRVQKKSPRQSLSSSSSVNERPDVRYRRSESRALSRILRSGSAVSGWVYRRARLVDAMNKTRGVVGVAWNIDSWKMGTLSSLRARAAERASPTCDLKNAASKMRKGKRRALTAVDQLLQERHLLQFCHLERSAIANLLLLWCAAAVSRVFFSSYAQELFLDSDRGRAAKGSKLQRMA
jgi:hypothetical protein